MSKPRRATTRPAVKSAKNDRTDSPGKSRPAPKAPSTSPDASLNGHANDDLAMANGHAAIGTASTPQSPAQDWEKTQEWDITWLSVAHVAPNPYQPRIEFDAEEMKDLVASVKAHGVHQPVTVRTLKSQESEAGTAHQGTEPTHHLVVGERRLRACKEAGRKRIPAIIRDDLTDAEVAELALVENVQRARLNAIEAARGYKRLMLDFRMKEERIAKRMGLSVQTIKDAIRLLQLPESVQVLITQKRLAPAHGQTLLRLANFPSVCEMVAQHTADNAITAKSLEANPLPNASALEKKGWIASLDWRTKFDWKNVCGSCPFGAYINGQFSGHCLKPTEWKAKNEAAIELQKQEAVRVMEEARQNESQTVEAEALPRVQYRSLAHGEPTGCTQACPCRRQMRDPDDATKTLPICIDPTRFDELRQAERQERERQSQAHYDELWHRAMQHCHEEIESGDQSKSLSLLLRAQLMEGRPYYTAPHDQWERAVALAKDLGIALDWDKLQDTETSTIEELMVLSQVETNKLLLFGVGLLLAQDARSAARFHEPAPLLAFVLNEPQDAQGVIEGLDEHEENDVAAMTEEATSDIIDNPEDEDETFQNEDDILTDAHEAETDLLESERESTLAGV